MRGLAALVSVLMFTVSGIALAATYKTGKYEQGAQSGFKATGVRIDIAKGSFNVERILMHETCSASGHPSIHDYAGFQQSSSAKLHGPINSQGGFAGTYHDGQGGYVKVTGHISGATLNLTGTEFGHYRPSGSTVTYTCKASGTFQPHHVS